MVYLPAQHLPQAASGVEAVLDHRQGHVARRHAQGHRRDARTPAPPPQSAARQARQLRSIFTQDSLSDVWNQITGSGFYFHVRGVERGADCRRRRRDEHHAGFGHRAHPRNRRAQSHWRAQARYPAAVHARGHHPTAMGGVLGVLLGAIITWTIPAIWSSLPAQMSVFWTIFGFAPPRRRLIFGIYPAWKAATWIPSSRCATNRSHGSVKGRGFEPRRIVRLNDSSNASELWKL